MRLQKNIESVYFCNLVLSQGEHHTLIKIKDVSKLELKPVLTGRIQSFNKESYGFYLVREDQLWKKKYKHLWTPKSQKYIKKLKKMSFQK